MNLRHIDPGSTDWMDAMLEGESDRSRKRETERPKVDSSHGLLAAGSPAATESIGSKPPETPR
jgi:hypothetical protein